MSEQRHYELSISSRVTRRAIDLYKERNERPGVMDSDLWSACVSQARREVTDGR